MRGNRIDIKEIYVVKGLDCRLDEIERKIDQLIEKVGQGGKLTPHEQEKLNQINARLDKVTNEIQEASKDEENTVV